MKRHPSELEILTACENPSASSATREHLDSGCIQCARRAAAWRTVISALRAPMLAEPPREWLLTALSRIRELAAEDAAPAETTGVRRHLEGAARNGWRALEIARAVLVLDTSLGPPLRGVRATPASGPRQLHYSSELGHVHLQIDPAPRQKLALRGQVLPAEGTLARGGRAVLEREGIEITRTLSSTGEFRFRGLTPGLIQLRVEWAHNRIELDGIELSPEGP